MSLTLSECQEYDRKGKESFELAFPTLKFEDLEANEDWNKCVMIGNEIYRHKNGDVYLYDENAKWRICEEGVVECYDMEWPWGTYRVSIDKIYVPGKN